MRIWINLARFGLVVALAVISYYAFKPSGMGGGFFAWDKADHFCAFFVITGLAMVAFPRLPIPVIGMVVAAFGVAIELVQGLPFIDRDMDVKDVIAELLALGAIFGTVVAVYIRTAAASAACEGPNCVTQTRRTRPDLKIPFGYSNDIAGTDDRVR
ncbi:hypothetical protein MMA231_04177 (plasmid) [Asticcacaulis sp. MM231]|uniref:hypothetical protein n=1 Tax=Asticcacaulis sp. MM231 TaxID=3157666 RepID=UPI0032D58E46